MPSVENDRIPRRRLSDELTVRLRKDIIDRGLKPGDRLPTEEEMAERFGVSRTVVREATKMLGFLGIIKVAPFQGMVLDHFDFGRVGEYLGFHFALSDYPAEELLRARDVIETGALRWTMDAMQEDPAVYPRLRKLAESVPMTDDAADLRWLDYEITFHRGLVDAGNIAPLASFCDLLEAFFLKFRPILRGVPTIGRDEHIQIVEALHAGSLHTAYDLLHTHVRDYYGRKDHLPPSVAPPKFAAG
jgi:GntR family transcriptional repressor for pyruvate dehydrogenase complex